MVPDFCVPNESLVEFWQKALWTKVRNRKKGKLETARNLKKLRNIRSTSNMQGGKPAESMLELTSNWSVGGRKGVKTCVFSHAQKTIVKQSRIMRLREKFLTLNLCTLPPFMSFRNKAKTDFNLEYKLKLNHFESSIFTQQKALAIT